MNRPLFWIIGSVLLLVVAILGARYFSLFKPELEPGIPEETEREEISEEEKGEEVPFIVEEVISGLSVPWSIVWTDPARMLIAERSGNIRAVIDLELQGSPVAVFEEVSTGGEEGLMGLAVDPNYDDNHFIYASLAYESGDGMFVKVVRLEDQGRVLIETDTILDRIPAAEFHAGSRIAFGPDGKLYITTGDAGERNEAQSTASVVGKILRIHADGTIPSDNPFPGSPIWSYGHRNPQGLSWHPETGELYSSEHGPSVFDGPAGGDEINRIVKGANYGWPLVSHEETRAGTVAPLRVFTPAEAPASLLVYSGRMLPQFRHNLFFGALKGEGLVRLALDPNNPDRILTVEKLAEVDYGRIRAVAEGPDGFIYFATSNRDGRGSPARTDDRIFRLRPENLE